MEIPTEPSEPLEAAIDDEELANLVLSAADSETFLEAIENPQPPNDELMKLAVKQFAPPLREAPQPPPDIRPAIFDPANYPEDARIADGWPVPGDFKLPRRAYTIGDTLADLSKYDSTAKKVLWLRHNDKLAFRYILKLAFDSNIKWKLPTGVPPFKAHKGRPGSAPSELLRECRRLYLYLEGGNDGVPRIKREKLFQQTIEGLEKEDVRALVAVKDRQVEHEFGLTRYIVEQAFPGLLQTPTQVRFITTR